jgi:hypothetical protein
LSLSRVPCWLLEGAPLGPGNLAGWHGVMELWGQAPRGRDTDTQKISLADGPSLAYLSLAIISPPETTATRDDKVRNDTDGR